MPSDPRRPTVPAWLPVLLPAGLALLLAGTGLAQAQAPLEQRYYQVELVVFAQPAGSAELRPRAGTAGKAEIEVEVEVEGELWLGEAGDAELPVGFMAPVLPRRLNAVAARLDRGGYRLLWHQAWVQWPGEPAGVELGKLAALGGGPADAGLSGTVSVSAGRFLHLGLELELHSSAGLEAVLSQRRRIRLDVEQYFDHPHIGVIAVLRRADAESLPGPDDGHGSQDAGEP